MSLGVLRCDTLRGGPAAAPLALQEGATLLVGRAADCNLRLDDNGVSRRALELVVCGGVPHLRACSRGGGGGGAVVAVLLNGLELALEGDTAVPLTHGDALLLTGLEGDYSLTWEAAGGDDATVKVRASHTV